MSTVAEDKAFASEMKGCIEVSFDNSALENAIDWIKNNMNPHEVFHTKDLFDWASGEDCEAIFSKSVLEGWAEANGYQKTQN